MNQRLFTDYKNYMSMRVTGAGPYQSTVRLLLCVCCLLGVSVLMHDIAAADEVSRPPAEDLDRRVVELYEQGRYKEAIARAKEVLSRNEKRVGKDHQIVAVSLNNLAALYERVGDYSRAQELHERSLAIREKRLGKKHHSYAISLNNLASVSEKRGEYRKAKTLFEQALDILENDGAATIPERLLVRENVARILKILGDIEKAEMYFSQILSAKRHYFAPDHPEIAKTLNNLALIKQILGDFSTAEAYYLESLAIRKAQLGATHPVIANSYNNLGSLYEQTGDFVSARDFYEQSLAIGRKSLGPNHPDVATIQNNLGILYKSVGNYAKARMLLTESLNSRQSILGDEHPALAANLINLAEIDYFEDNLSGAESLYKKSLKAAESELGPSHPLVAAAMVNLASLYIQSGKYDKALQILNRHESPMLTGYYSLMTGDFEEAVTRFQQSLRINEEQRKTKFIPVNHIGLGNAYETLENYTLAEEHYARAIEVIESQWISLDVTSKRTFLTARIGLNYTRLDAYEGIIRVIFKSGSDDAAEKSLGYAEKIKSRILLEMLAGKRVDPRDSVEADILEKERNLQDRIYKARFRLAQLTRLIDEPSGEIVRAEKDLQLLHQQYESFIHDVKLTKSGIIDLIAVEPLDLKALQAQLDKQTTLVEFLTTAEKLYVWLISDQQIRVETIPVSRRALDQKINELLLPGISNKSRRSSPKITLSSGTITRDGDRGIGVENRDNFIEYLSALGDLLLPTIQDNAHTAKLVIVPHGSLHKIPFSAITANGATLLDHYEISTIPSASLLQQVRKQKNEDKDRLLAFSNPLTVFPSLDYAEQEVENIEHYFSRKTIYSGSNATETRAKLESGNADIIHFASHGEFNDRQPMQSGLILANDDKNDGYLQVHEIFGLNLAEANLVTLSACDTGLSKIQGGDDLIGLSRGFIYAGTPAILATLWQIDDRASAQLISLFYDNWRHKAMTKADALRQAQLDIRSRLEYQHPFFWAPFVLIGN